MGNAIFHYCYRLLKGDTDKLSSGKSTHRSIENESAELGNSYIVQLVVGYAT